MKWIALILLALLMASPSQGQQRSSRPAQQAAPPPAQPAPPPPPTGYEPLLLRLAEVMGGVAYLSDLCGGAVQAPDAVRRKMQELIDTEAQNELQRERLAGAYNRGFTGYQMHRICRPGSRIALERLVQEGTRLSQEISARFGS